ncbi:DUF1707 domain-containing protein [Actinocorallia sp. API 0066]|uniref:DUF1707 domain-containing protein n=1 Tax=Actinocorallia sp. API 0066 TaxID=2896846 RepID=UPI001E560A3C|nr:DUF1707 domain-containing protein [Actinocorallia sp. API 0066]MCD0450319.1 DUF1707 domain-containing protein [Actinocorallia sp. API 0066]
MPSNPEMRASDRDRDRFAEILRDNFAQGRLNHDELNERLAAAYAARTIGDLEALTADLPEQDMYDLPIPASQPVPATRPGAEMTRYEKGLRAAWAGYATVNLITFSIWLVTVVASGSLIYPWFLWVAGPWGAVLLASTIFGTRPPGSR